MTPNDYHMHIQFIKYAVIVLPGVSLSLIMLYIFMYKLLGTAGREIAEAQWLLSELRKIDIDRISSDELAEANCLCIHARRKTKSYWAPLLFVPIDGADIVKRSSFDASKWTDIYCTLEKLEE